MTTSIRLAILLALWGVIFIPVYPALIDAWLSNSNHSHGLLVPLVVLYLVWQKKESLRQTPISTSGWGGALLVSGLAMYLVGLAGGVALPMRLAIVVSLIGLILFVLGPDVLKTLLFPLFFLMFMIPVPDSFVGLVSFPLQLFATTASAFFIDWMSVPVLQEGNMLYFVNTQLEVAEACSGIHSLLAIVMLAVLLAYMMESSQKEKMILVLSAVPIALVANIVRVTGTGILAHFFGSQVARGFLHTFSGLVVFLFGFTLLLFEYYLLGSLTKRRTTDSTAG